MGETARASSFKELADKYKITFVDTAHMEDYDRLQMRNLQLFILIVMKGVGKAFKHLSTSYEQTFNQAYGVHTLLEEDLHNVCESALETNSIYNSQMQTFKRLMQLNMRRFEFGCILLLYYEDL